MTSATHPAERPTGRVAEVARLFLLLGSVGFGGPAAHIALMRDQTVRRRQWLDDAEFADYVGATNLIPGPNSTELAIHLGHRRAGGWGLVTAGVCFITPAVLIVGVLAWAYERYGSSPVALDLRYGVLPVIVAVIAHAVVGLGRATLRTPLPVVLAAVTFVAALAGIHELVLLALAGAFAAAAAADRLHGRISAIVLPTLLAATGTGPTSSPTIRQIFLVFLEMGSVIYGSGYVLVAFMQRMLVDDRGWLTTQQLLDAVAVGQVTPGPVFTTATFVGWQLGGVAGAAAATVGIFLPSFVFVAFLGRIVRWMRARPVARAFLSGVTAASLGLMAAALVRLLDDALVDVLTVATAAVALVLLIRTRLNSVWLVAGGLALGVVHALV